MTVPGVGVVTALTDGSRDNRRMSSDEALGAIGDCLKYRLRVRRRIGDNLQDIGRRSVLDDGIGV
jgi:hypothetical protein